jgi:hypothetical protein
MGRGGRPTAKQFREMCARCGAPFGVPTRLTAEKLWDLVAPELGFDISAITTTVAKLTAAERDVAETTAKQALAIALDTAVACGEDGKALSAIRMFAALAEVWSPAYRAARTRGARRVFEMTADTIRAAWDELLHQGVHVRALWSTVTSGSPAPARRQPDRAATVADLYKARLQRPQKVGRGPRHRQYFIRLIPPATVYSRHRRGHRVGSKIREPFEQLLTADSEYQRQAPRVRLLLADDEPPPVKIDRVVASEREYDVMHVGDGATEIRQRLETARLYLDLRTVQRDRDRWRTNLKAHGWRPAYRAWGRHPEVRAARQNVDADERRAEMKRLYRAWLDENDKAALRLRNSYRTLKGRYQAARSVMRQVDRLRRAGRISSVNNRIAIKSTFFVGKNRRWYARNIWVPDTSSKEPFAEVVDSDWKKNTFRICRTTQRGRWFLARVLKTTPDGWRGLRPMYAVDVSSSMDHLLAIVLGYREEERQIVEGELAPKDARARRAWDAAGRGQVVLIGFTGAEDHRLRNCISEIQNTRYGADVSNLAKLLQNDPATYGPGLGSADNVCAFLKAVEAPYDQIWLRTCRALADAAIAQDGGVHVLDPLDETEFTWNPPRIRKRVISHEEHKLIVGEVAGLREDKLRNRVAPGLIHMLDAAFAAEVIRALNAAEVHDVAIVHDCFLVPEDAREILIGAVGGQRSALSAAGEAWLQRLRPFYELFERYLGEDREYGPIVRGWRALWEQRVANEDWPTFRVKPELLFEEFYRDAVR